jgi:hypothetical protein
VTKPPGGIEDPPDHTGPGGLERLERWLKKQGTNLWGGRKGAPPPGPPPPPSARPLGPRPLTPPKRTS